MTDTSKDGALAHEVWLATQALTTALAAAGDAGLRVEVAIHQRQTIGMKYSTPTVVTTVSRDVAIDG